MYQLHPAIRLYAPLQALIYQDHEGVTHFTYDRPSSLLWQFDHDEVRSVARLLDDRMSTLADWVTSDA